jgi:hypothetical protein
MPTIVNLKKLLHRKAWESCTSAPVAMAAGAFVVSDKFDITNGARAFLVASASSIWMYEGNEDAWCQLPNSGATGTFAAGACGEYRGLGAMGGAFTQTATAGSVTTITTSRTIVRDLSGSRVRVIAGAGAGYDGAVASNTLGANAIITVTPASGVAFDSTTQFQVFSGSLWFFNSGTTVVGFSVYDVATNAWTARSVAGLPVAWGTDAKLVATIGAVSAVATGTVTAGASTTLTNSAKTWAANMWANYQVRITGGTGAGQIRTITSNTATALTVSAAWAVTPDATSTYSIEGNHDHFYLLGNNAVTMYRYTVSSNTWATLAPTAARAGAAAVGVTASWIESAPGWDNETQVAHYGTTVFKQNGRYIFSFRGGATNTLDVYDIAANTWVSGLAYGNQQETFTTGSSAADISGAIYIAKEASGRVFAFDVARNRLLPLTTNTTQAALGGTAVVGDKLFFLPYRDGTTTINYMYMMRHSGAELVRMLLI